MNIPPIIDVAGVLISSQIFTEFFCCKVSVVWKVTLALL